MTILITIAIVFVALLCLGPIGVAILAGALTLAWVAVRVALYAGAIAIGAIVLPIWWLFDREGASAAWRAGRRA